MKRSLCLIPLLGLMAILAMPLIPVKAETNLQMSWDGSGSISAVFNTSDAFMLFNTAGNRIWGSLNATDYDDNPYSYGVDTFEARVKSFMEGGGEAEFYVSRLVSHESMYGPADEESHTYLSTSDQGHVIFRVRTNFARLRSSNYGYQSDSHFWASGLFYIEHSLTNGLNYATLAASGDGEIRIDHMSDDTFGSEFKFGFGCGCYTNSDAEASGTGVFEVYAHGENGLYGDGWSAGGPAEYHFGVIYGDGFQAEGYWVGGS